MLRKVEQIVREEMDSAGAQELLLPIVQPLELWQRRGRDKAYGPLIFKLTDRKQRGFALAPTAEEVITVTVSNEYGRYRDLPVNLYRMNWKYRDELRPRFGLLRSREFLMKDAYSFDADIEGLKASYKLMYDAYHRVFERCGLSFRPVEAQAGEIGGDANHEFMAVAAVGEDDFVWCRSCDYAANVEAAVRGPARWGWRSCPATGRSTRWPSTGRWPAARSASGRMPTSTPTPTSPRATSARTSRARRCGSPTRRCRPARPAAGSPAPTRSTITSVTPSPDATSRSGPSPISSRWRPGIHVPVAVRRCPSTAASRSVTRSSSAPNTRWPSRRSTPTRRASRIPWSWAAAASACPGWWRPSSRNTTTRTGWRGRRPSPPTRCTSSACRAGARRPPEVRAAADRLYDELKAAGVDVLYDDRDPGVTFADTDLLGVPTQLVLGGKGLARGVVERKGPRSGELDEVALEAVVGVISGR